MNTLLTSVKACRKCGAPGAALHFPGGYLCRGGCSQSVLPEVCHDTPITRVPEVLVREARPRPGQLKRFHLVCSGFRVTLYQHIHQSNWHASISQGYCPKENEFGVLVAMEKKIHELAFGPPVPEFEI